jgi:hypothetical protein
MPQKITTRVLQNRAQRLVDAQNMRDLSPMLRTDSVRLATMAADPKYREYQIPKKTPGTFRQIEDPDDHLKKAQRHLNAHLQALYYQIRHPAAYGFVTCPTDDHAPRNILSNATRHLGAQWLLNVDMQDFFHLIKEKHVADFFATPQLNFKKLTAKRLAALCCYKGRLPMGAPTSPAISNFIAYPLDVALQDFADDRGWTYTRYADDLSFSSLGVPITRDEVPDIAAIVVAHDLKLNPAKSKLFGPDASEKSVTGLVLGPEGVALSQAYVQNLQDGIAKLSSVLDTRYLMPSGRKKNTLWVTEMEQRIRGRVEFAKSILPEDDTLRIQLEMAYADALDPPKTYGQVSWMDLGYDFFTA